MYTRPTPPSDDEQQRSIALLTDREVRIALHRASALAAEHSFESLLTHVFCYLRDLAGKQVYGTGALITRIRDDYAGVLVPADRETELWQRHVPPDMPLTIAAMPVDDEEARRRQYIPPEYADIILG